jgi:hypothetical protein
MPLPDPCGTVRIPANPTSVAAEEDHPADDDDRLAADDDHLADDDGRPDLSSGMNSRRLWR